MKIIVDRDLCESNGLCVEACPSVFRIDDADRLIVLVDEPSEALRTQLEQAVHVCPRQALSLED
jgi:ferredoxin